MKFFKTLCSPDYTPFNSPLGACHRLLYSLAREIINDLAPPFKFTGRCFQFSLRNKGPFKVPFKELFFFLRLRLSWRPHKMENLCECSSHLRRGSGKCWELWLFFRAKTQFYADFPSQFDCGEIPLLRSS